MRRNGWNFIDKFLTLEEFTWWNVNIDKNLVRQPLELQSKIFTDADNNVCHKAK
jgi:hypothetical protein